MKIKLSLVLLFLIQTYSTFAADFVKITIPDAKCGNGEAYSVYLKKNSAQKLLVEFMGGGACWNYDSCFANPKTSLAPITSPGPFSVLSTDGPGNPFDNSTMLYFPYCTGDVHIGNHIANYDGKTVYHYGSKNIDLTLKYLADNNLIAFDSYKDVTVWGASAGAIGSLFYGKKIEPLLSSQAKKTLILDSPGLHYGPTFWDKFSARTLADFAVALFNVHIIPNFNDGFIAKKLRPTFYLYHEWTIGVLIATKDRVMSTVFGDITPEEHEKLVLGPEGIPAIAQEFSNIKVWLQDSGTHTFLVSKKSSETESIDKMKAIDFARALVKGESLP